MAVSMKYSEEIEVADDEHTYENLSIAKQSKVKSEVGVVTASDPQSHLEQEKLLDQLHSLKMPPAIEKAVGVGRGDPDVVVGLPLLTGTITTPATIFELIFVICYLPCTSKVVLGVFLCMVLVPSFILFVMNAATPTQCGLTNVSATRSFAIALNILTMTVAALFLCFRCCSRDQRWCFVIRIFIFAFNMLFMLAVIIMTIAGSAVAFRHEEAAYNSCHLLGAAGATVVFSYLYIGLVCIPAIVCCCYATQQRKLLREGEHMCMCCANV